MSPLVPAGGAVDPELLAQITQFALTSRRVAQSAVAGMHRAYQRGSSIAFAEHKLYSPGDDVRHLDWHAFAKTDKFHIKQYEDEVRLTLQLWVDASGSMGYGDGGRPHKLAYAQQLAGALAYLALGQGDAAGLVTFGGDKNHELPARQGMGYFVDIASSLFLSTPRGATALSAVVAQMAQRPRQRQQIIVLTDLFDAAPKQAFYDSLKRLTARKHEVAVLHILDPTELSFEFEAPASFASMEDARRLFVHPRAIKSRYIKQMRHFLDDTSRLMAQSQVRYLQVLTSQPAHQTLADYLGRLQGR